MEVDAKYIAGATLDGMSALGKRLLNLPGSGNSKKMLHLILGTFNASVNTPKSVGNQAGWYFKDIRNQAMLMVLTVLRFFMIMIIHNDAKQVMWPTRL